MNDALMQALMGDYRPETQDPMKKKMIGDQFNEAKLQEIAQRLAKAGYREDAAAVLSLIGIGATGLGVVTGNPVAGFGGAGVAAIGLNEAAKARMDQSKLYGEQSDAMPGIYGSQ